MRTEHFWEKAQEMSNSDCLLEVDPALGVWLGGILSVLYMPLWIVWFLKLLHILPFHFKNTKRQREKETELERQRNRKKWWHACVKEMSPNSETGDLLRILTGSYVLFSRWTFLMASGRVKCRGENRGRHFQLRIMRGCVTLHMDDKCLKWNSRFRNGKEEEKRFKQKSVRGILWLVRYRKLERQWA